MATYGYAGKILRLNLTTLSATTEDSTKYQEFLGGMGIGYKILFDEVPVGTKPYDPESKIVFSAGPLTGTGAPCSGRCTVTLLSPVTEIPMVVDAHMGGHFAPQIKYAGYDAIVLEGKADHPVWVKVDDDTITFEDAASVWGKGIFEATDMINAAAGEDFCVCAIGPAGENLVNYSIVSNSRSHSGGNGSGAVLGSKNVKAIAVRGTKPVPAYDVKKLLELYDYANKEIMGANNNHVVPAMQQSWNEYVANTRWQGGPGVQWGSAVGGPMEIGETLPGDVNSVGLRSPLSVFYHGAVTAKHIVKQVGCQSCPIRCYSVLKLDAMKDYNLPTLHAQTCLAADHFGFYPEGYHDFEDEGDGKMYIGQTTARAMDDMGLWDNYGMLDSDFTWCYKNGVFERVLPKEEYDSIPWQQMKDGDPRFVVEIVRRIAMKEGEISRLGMGCVAIAKAWELGDDYWNKNSKFFLKLGFPKHHSSESYGQVGALINILFNRDPMCHTHQNILGAGLPHELKREIVGEFIGSPDCMDAPAHYTPMNPYKAKFARWSIVRNNVHDMATLCNWTWALVFSPKKERGYKGDVTLEAQIMSAATGIEYTAESLDLMGEKVLHLHRAMTALEMNSANLRKDHDAVADLIFDLDPDIPAFSEGTTKLDRADWETALDMFFDELGWDKATGIPTRATLERFNMADVADRLAAAGLLPA